MNLYKMLLNHLDLIEFKGVNHLKMIQELDIKIDKKKQFRTSYLTI